MNAEPEQPAVTVDRRTGLDRRRGHRRRGRPRLADESETLSALVPVAIYDRLSIGHPSSGEFRERGAAAIVGGCPPIG